MPIRNTAAPSAMATILPSFFPRDDPELSAERMMIRPTSEMAKIPPSHATSCMFRRVSRWKMWLNSCAITPWSSSRESCSMQPRVTPMTASCSPFPAANALIDGSSIRNTGGTRTPLAMAISSTTLRMRRSAGSADPGSTCTPPIASATARPPCDICANFTAMPITTTTSTEPSEMPSMRTSAKFPLANRTVISTCTLAIVASSATTNIATSLEVFRLARSWLSKKSMVRCRPQPTGGAEKSTFGSARADASASNSAAAANERRRATSTSGNTARRVL